MPTHTLTCIGAGDWEKNFIQNLHALGVLFWVCAREPDRRAQVAAAHPMVRCTDTVNHIKVGQKVAQA